ncbi:M48 family metalloprotease [Sinorhizobium fredii]|uniref:M48 family metalloprotease n=1 Tax=Rhizobium fredii TaxID=380 RepID=UPI0011802B77|nr:M48 family metalloprotease [Sinorhizobium fredii]
MQIYRILAKMPRDRDIFLRMPYLLRVFAGLTNRGAEETFSSLRNLNWAKSHVDLLRRRFKEVRTLCANKEIAIGVKSEAEFNGEYYRLPGGFVLAFPSGVQTFLRFEAEMFGDISDITFRQKMAEGFSQAVRAGNGWTTRRWRQFRVWRRKRQRTNEQVRDLAWGVERTLRCYADLNTVDRPEFDRGKSPLPFGPFFVGHPLEAGTHLSTFATNFLLLHELGHVKHGHDDERISTCCERQADDFAITAILSNQYDDSEKVANLVGAYFSLHILGRLEGLEQSQEHSTHPPAQRRIQALEARVEASNASLRVKNDFQAMTDHLSKLGQLFQSYKAAENMPHTVYRNLIGCISMGLEDLFKDQVLRWMLVGSSTMLCNYLGNLKYRLEQNLESLDEKTRLKALQEIYEVLELTKNVLPISSKLQFAYKNAAR